MPRHAARGYVGVHADADAYNEKPDLDGSAEGTRTCHIQALNEAE